MATVFVTSESRYPELETLAARYGEIKYMTGSDFLNIRDSETNEQILWKLRQKLSQFDPQKDFLIIGSNPTMVAAVFALLGWMQIREFCILRWDNKNRDYIPLWLKFRPEVTFAV